MTGGRFTSAQERSCPLFVFELRVLDSHLPACAAVNAYYLRYKLECTMENPPKQFMAGADAIAAVKPVLEERLAEIHAYKDLSKESAGSFA